MSDGLFINRKNKTHQLTLRVYDEDDDGFVVWRAEMDDEIRFVEGHRDEDSWTLVDKAVHAYDE